MSSVLLLASLASLTGKNAQSASIMLAVVLLGYFLLAYAPRLAANRHDLGLWTSGADGAGN